MIQEIMEEAIKNEQEICDRNFEDCIEEIQTEKIEMKNSSFRNCICTNSKLERAYFYNVVFENCDFSNTNFQNSDFVKVKFVNCKLIGCKFIDAMFSEVTMTGNNFKYSDLYHTAWKNVHSKENNYTSTSIGECQLKQVTFDFDCFVQSQLFQTKLKGIDFSNCDISGIIVDITDIKGMKVNELQALELSKLLGIVIK